MSVHVLKHAEQRRIHCFKRPTAMPSSDKSGSPTYETDIIFSCARLRMYEGGDDISKEEYYMLLGNKKQRCGIQKRSFGST